jgi:hypothetical protein
MPRQKPSPLRCSITGKRAADIALSLVSESDDTEIGDLIYLLRALTFTDDASDREDLLIAVEGRLMPYLTCADESVNTLVEKRQQAAKEVSK